MGHITSIIIHLQLPEGRPCPGTLTISRCCVCTPHKQTLSVFHSALHCIKTPKHRKSFISAGCCKWQMSMQAGHTCEGVPMVCLPIWHWYMLRGDWLKSLKGVRLATTLSMALQLISRWLYMPSSPACSVPSGHLQQKNMCLGL